MVGRTEAKAIENNFFVGQERRLGDQNRLDTDVVQAVNDSFQRIFLKGCLSFVDFELSFEGSNQFSVRKNGEDEQLLFFYSLFLDSSKYLGF